MCQWRLVCWSQTRKLDSCEAGTWWCMLCYFYGIQSFLVCNNYVKYIINLFLSYVPWHGTLWYIYRLVITYPTLRASLHWCTGLTTRSRNWLVHAPLPSNRHHRSHGECLEGTRENYQVCSVQYCVQQLCTVQCTHRWTNLTVLWIGFCFTGPISPSLHSFCICIILCITVYCMYV